MRCLQAAHEEGTCTISSAEVPGNIWLQKAPSWHKSGRLEVSQMCFFFLSLSKLGWDTLKMPTQFPQPPENPVFYWFLHCWACHKASELCVTSDFWQRDCDIAWGLQNTDKWVPWFQHQGILLDNKFKILLAFFHPISCYYQFVPKFLRRAELKCIQMYPCSNK